MENNVFVLMQKKAVTMMQITRMCTCSDSHVSVITVSTAFHFWHMNKQIQWNSSIIDEMSRNSNDRYLDPPSLYRPIGGTWT